MSIEVCCDWLTEHLMSAGDRGFSVVPETSYGRSSFFLQARPVSASAARRAAGATEAFKDFIASQLGNEIDLIAIAFGVRLVHCPHCGRNLDAWIAGNRSAFEAMEVEMKSYALHSIETL